MAAYPSIGLQHTIRPLTRRRTDLADDGTIRSVDLNAADAYQILLVHPVINATDRDTLLSFYNTNKANVNTITLMGITYDVTFQSDYAVESLSATYFTLTVELRGNKQ